MRDYPFVGWKAPAKLIVVSNRICSYSLDAEGNRVARARRRCLVTALRGLVSHHDVT